jgi:RNase P/RNase MRP subunit POP5
MKSLKPTMREKKRYLLVEGAVSDIEKAIYDGIGVLGVSKAGFSQVKTGKGFVVIAVNREAVDSIRACFAIWPKEIIVKRVSGTLKGLNKS